MKTVTYALKQLLLVMALFAGSTTLGQNLGYYAFIPNADGDIDKDGFDIGYHSVFPQWDLNADGNISETELNSVMFKRLDTNGDKTLTEEEWSAGKHFFGILSNSGEGNNEQGLKNDFAIPRGKSSQNDRFSTYDTDNDSMLSFSEFQSAIKSTGIFSSFDPNRDGKLTRKELNSMVYRLMDLDGNGIIGKKEFDTVGNLYIN